MSDTKNINLDGTEKFTCAICGKEIEGYSYNAYPAKNGSCCEECNRTVVIPARLKETEN